MQPIRTVYVRDRLRFPIRSAHKTVVASMSFEYEEKRMLDTGATPYFSSSPSANHSAQSVLGSRRLLIGCGRASVYRTSIKGRTARPSASPSGNRVRFARAEANTASTPCVLHTVLCRLRVDQSELIPTSFATIEPDSIDRCSISGERPRGGFSPRSGSSRRAKRDARGPTVGRADMSLSSTFSS